LGPVCFLFLDQDFEIKAAKVCATCNEINRLSKPLQSRFRKLFLPRYSEPQFLDVSEKVLAFVRMPMSHFIACKNYDERITTVHRGKVYDCTFSMERGSIQRQVRKDKRILLVDDEHDVNLTIRIVLEENGFKVDSFTDASQALEKLYSRFI
jgi:CheY-like chemotaxis protein